MDTFQLLFKSKFCVDTLNGLHRSQASNPYPHIWIAVTKFSSSNKMSWLFRLKAWFNTLQTCRGRKGNPTQTLRRHNAHKIITYFQHLNWEAALPRWTHAGRSGSGEASWRERSSSRRSQSKWEMFLRAHCYLVKKTEKCWNWARQYLATCCFLFLMCSLLPLPLPPLKQGRWVYRRGVEVGGWSRFCKCCRSNAEKHFRSGGSHSFRCWPCDYTAKILCFTTTSLSHITSSVISESCLVCAPWHQLHHFLAASVVHPLQADFLSSLLPFHLHHLRLLQACAALCTAMWFQGRISSALRRRWGRRGLLSFTAHSVDVCMWLPSGDTISLQTV